MKFVIRFPVVLLIILLTSSCKNEDNGTGKSDDVVLARVSDKVLKY